jgi:hypothetical protein
MTPSLRRYLPHVLAVVSPLLLVLVAAVTFREFVIHSIATSPELNGLILAAAFAGFAMLLLRLRALIFEWQALDSFTSEVAAPGLPRLTQSQDLISQLKVIVGGERLTHAKRNAIQKEVEKLEQGLESRLELGNYMVGLMIALGLLGTFIGLLETLVGVGTLIGNFADMGAEGMEESFRNLIGSLKAPLAAMGIAFSASMFGLVGSLVLGLMLLGVRSTQAAFLQDLQTSVAKVLADGETRTPDFDAADTLTALQTAFGDLFDYQRRFDFALREQAALALANEQRQKVLQEQMALLSEQALRRSAAERQLADQAASLPLILRALEASLTRSDQHRQTSLELNAQLASWRSDLGNSVSLVSQQLQDHSNQMQNQQIKLMDELIRGTLENRLSEINTHLQASSQLVREAQVGRQGLDALGELVQGLNQTVQNVGSSVQAQNESQRTEIEQLKMVVLKYQDDLAQLATRLAGLPEAPATDSAQQTLVLREMAQTAEMLQREFRLAAGSLKSKAGK